jgi:release factor glutamine methyltransferase
LAVTHKTSKPIQVLDIFSGSGAVGVAVAKYFQKNTIDGYVTCSEVDEKLLPQITKNMELNKIDPLRYEVVQGDVFSGVSKKYDFIFTVPPYVDPANKEEVMKELVGEPELSFFDKEDGFYFHKKVLREGKEYLNEKGILYLEFDITQREKIEMLAEECGWSSYSFLKDPYGHEYVLMCYID